MPFLLEEFDEFFSDDFSLHGWLEAKLLVLYANIVHTDRALLLVKTTLIQAIY